MIWDEGSFKFRGTTQIAGTLTVSAACFPLNAGYGQFSTAGSKVASENSLRGFSAKGPFSVAGGLFRLVFSLLFDGISFFLLYCVLTGLVNSNFQQRSRLNHLGDCAITLFFPQSRKKQGKRFCSRFPRLLRSQRLHIPGLRPG